MKTILMTAMLLGAFARADVSGTASAVSAAAKPLEFPTKVHAFMLGDKLLVTGSSLGLASEKDARIFAVKDAAQAAAEFLEKKGLGKSMEIQRGVENALLLEKPLVAEELGQIKIEDLRQERWSNEAGVDKWSIHLVLSIGVGKKHKAKK